MRSLKILQQITERQSGSLDKYFNEIGKLEMITADEEVYLASKIKKGDQVALERLIKANLRFVVSVAKQYHKGSHFSLGDLINEGNLGLINAAQRFDETRGFKFISYAVWWIRQSIMQAITQKNRLVRLPLNRISEINKMFKVVESLAQSLERDPTSEEISDHLNISSKDVRLIQRVSKFHMSLDSPIGHEDNSLNLGDTLQNQHSIFPEDKLMQVSLQEEIRNMLSSLDNRARKIIVMFYGLSGKDPMSLDAISKELCLNRETIRQIKQRTILKLKSKFKYNAELRSFLN